RMTSLDGEIIPPRKKRDGVDVDAELARLERIANLLDACIEIPGTSIRIGLDPIVGLIPGIGDVIGFAASVYIVERLTQLGISPLARARMIGNIVIDAAVGAIPVLGDIFDAGFKANVMNLELARRDLGR